LPERRAPSLRCVTLCESLSLSLSLSLSVCVCVSVSFFSRSHVSSERFLDRRLDVASSSAIFDDVGGVRLRGRREEERKRKKRSETELSGFFFRDTLFVNALPFCYLLLLLLLVFVYVTRLCTTLCAGYFRIWPVRYTNGRRTRAELSVATHVHVHVHVHARARARARVFTRTKRRAHVVDDVHKRPYIRAHTHVDRCTCPCSARPAVTLNRSDFAARDCERNFFQMTFERERERERSLRVIY